MNNDILYGPVSPDGLLLPIVSNLDFGGDVTLGDARLLHLEIGERTIEPFARTGVLFQWQL